ncbi:MAG: GatB/YqeY domain-containing protein [bacterium]
MIFEDIKNNIKEAMKAKDQVRLDVMRGLSSAFTNELVATGRKPQEELSDEECLKVITRLAKQRKDSIEQFTKGGRMDLVVEEEAQLKVLEVFLPTMMSKEEVEQQVKAIMTKLGEIDPTKKGLLMKEVMVELKGKADGSTVKEVIDGLFNA